MTLQEALAFADQLAYKDGWISEIEEVVLLLAAEYEALRTQYRQDCTDAARALRKVNELQDVLGYMLGRMRDDLGLDPDWTQKLQTKIKGL